MKDFIGKCHSFIGRVKGTTTLAQPIVQNSSFNDFQVPGHSVFLWHALPGLRFILTHLTYIANGKKRVNCATISLGE